MSTDILIRKAQAGDIESILEHRSKMFAEMGFSPQQVRVAIERARHEFYRGILGNNFHAWLAKVGEKVVAVSAVLLQDWPSHPSQLETHRRAYVINVFTQPEYRGLGVARKMMAEIIAWAKRQRHGALWLHPSEQAKSFYEEMGFVLTTEMKLALDRHVIE
jgi:GNAT superfamily N-acetyltransferase